MTDLSKYERPNTVSGLLAKHKDLCLLREKYREEVKKITLDLYHLEATIRMFDPGAHDADIKQNVARRRAAKGSIKRFLLNTLREAPEPMTSRQIAELWVEECGLEADEPTINLMRKRVSSCIKTSVKQGLLEDVGQTTEHDAYGPYKLWRIALGVSGT